METMGDRLRLAREQAGFSSARSAAQRHHWTVSTYSAHENGQNDYDEEAARKYAKAFRVSAGWLLTGEGLSKNTNIVGVKGLVGAGGAIDTGAEQIQESDDLYEIEVPFPLPEGAFALEVRGESMVPRFEPGDVVVCLQKSESVDDFIGQEVVVSTKSGARFLKRLLDGGRKGLFDLESRNALTMRKQKIQWASPILGILPASQWRRVP